MTLAAKSLNIFVSDEEAVCNFGYEPEDLVKAAAPLQTCRVPNEIQKLLKMLKREPGFVDESEASEEEREMNSRNKAFCGSGFGTCGFGPSICPL